jgi:uncharacterized protein (DUF1330 family)
MAKGYWILCYRSISNPAAVAEYAKLAGPAIQTAGGHALVRGVPTKTYEAGRSERTVLIEFESVEKAIAAYESDGYRAALRALNGAADRDVRMIEGIT